MSARSSSSTPQMRLRSRGAALRQQVEIVDQPRHRRVVAVGGLGLQREAFGERARADARRVEALDQRQRLLDQRQRRAGQLGDLVERDGQIAGLVERLGDDPREIADVARTAPCSWSMQMLGERRRGIFEPGRNRSASSPPPDVTTSAKLSVSSASAVQSTSSGRSSSAWPDDQVVRAGIVGRFVAVAFVARRSRRPAARRRLVRSALRAAGSSTAPRR